MHQPIKAIHTQTNWHSKPRRLCVFCGSAHGRNSDFTTAAQELGRELARRGIGLVYGGATVGLMGLLADAALGAGGEVIGVIPESLMAREIGHAGLTKLHVVGSMHERKALMAELADGFVALPGGFGTFEEFFEVVTWAQLGLHAKPCSLLNIAGFFDPLLRLLDTAVAEGFIKPAARQSVTVESSVASLLDRFSTVPTPVHKQAGSAEAAPRAERRPPARREPVAGQGDERAGPEAGAPATPGRTVPAPPAHGKIDPRKI